MVRVKSASPLWLPESAQPRMFVCRICGEEIPLTDARSQELHVVACSGEHQDVLSTLSPAARLGWWNDPVDPEWEAYNLAIRDAGRDPEEQYNRGRKSNIRRASES